MLYLANKISKYNIGHHSKWARIEIIRFAYQCAAAECQFTIIET